MIVSFSLVGCKEEAAVEAVEEEVEEEAVEEEVEEEVSVYDMEGEIKCTMYPGAPMQDGRELMEWEIEAFEKLYPNIKVNLVPLSPEDPVTVMHLELESSDSPDIGTYWTGTYLETTKDTGYLADINDIWQEINFDEVAPSAASLAQFDSTGNAKWILPIEIGGFGFWYNMHVWEDAGLTEEDIPRTWDDLLNVAQTILDSGAYPFVRSTGTVGYTVGIWLDMIMERTAGRDIRRSFGPGEITFEDPAWAKADSYWMQLLPYWHPDVATLTYDEALMSVVTGESAMMLLGSWAPGTFETQYEMVAGQDYSFFSFPIIDPDIPRGEIVTPSNGIILSTKGLVNPAAVELLKYFSSKDAQQMWADARSMTVVHKDVTYTAKILETFSKEMGGWPVDRTFGFDATIYPDLSDIWELRLLDRITLEESIDQMMELYKPVYESLEE